MGKVSSGWDFGVVVEVVEGGFLVRGGVGGGRGIVGLAVTEGAKYSASVVSVICTTSECTIVVDSTGKSGSRTFDGTLIEASGRIHPAFGVLCCGRVL